MIKHNFYPGKYFKGFPFEIFFGNKEGNAYGAILWGDSGSISANSKKPYSLKKRVTVWVRFAALPLSDRAKEWLGYLLESFELNKRFRDCWTIVSPLGPDKLDGKRFSFTLEKEELPVFEDWEIDEIYTRNLVTYCREIFYRDLPVNGKGKKILWVGGFDPSQRHYWALEKMFGERFQLIVERNLSAEETTRLFRDDGYDEIIVPEENVFAELVSMGIKPIGVQMEEVEKPSQSEVKVGRKYYRFKRFYRPD